MKRQISFIAALVMLVTTVFSGNVFAAFDDVQDDNRYKNAIITLNKLAVIDGYDDGTFKPEGQITRAEFTKMLITALGYGDNTTEPTEFDDVTDHWARHYIKTAYDLGIINGTGERTFEPDNPVTYEQGLKMLVCTLGYEAYAQSRGGYPQGFISVADSMLSLGTNIVGQANSEPALRQVVAQMFYNALEVDMQEENSLGVVEKSGKTILKDHLDVVKLKGKLIGVEDTKTNECNVNLVKNQIAVLPTYSKDGTAPVVINLGSFTDVSIGEFAKLLGNELTFYYRQGGSDDDKELKILDNETTNNSVRTVSYKNFLDFSGNTFRYTDGPDRKTLNIKSDVTVIYNGQTLTDNDLPIDIEARYSSESGSTKTVSTMSELLGLWLGSDDEYNVRGEVTFTDSGSDGTWDILSINDYKTIVAYKAPTTADYRLQNKLKTGDGIVLDPDDITKKIYIEKAGKSIAATAIRADDVVSYTVSLDESIINAYVSTSTVEGEVTSINEASKIVTIAGTEYDLGEDCVKYIQEKEGRTLAAGVEGKFYLDKLGTIVYGTLKSVVVNPYAYISNVSISDEDGAAYITLYAPSVSTTSTGTYKLADKVKINNTQVKDYGDAVDILAEVALGTNSDTDASLKIYQSGALAAVNTGYSQPVRAKINTVSREITDIYTVNFDADADSSLTKQNEDPEKVVRYRDLAQYYYTGSSFKKKSADPVEFAVNSTTTVLYVPRDRSEKSGYSKKTISNAFISGNYYYVEAYDVNKSNVASLVILYGDTGKLNEINDTTDFSIVAKRAEEEYSSVDEATVSKITVYSGATTSTTSWQALNRTDFADVMPGDVIQFAYDDDKRIQGRQNVIRYADISSVLNDTSGQNVSYADGTSRKEIFNWNVENDWAKPGYSWSDSSMTEIAALRYQPYKFDFCYPSTNAATLVEGVKSGSRTIEEYKSSYFTPYTSSVLGTVAKSRVCVYNVYQLIEDTNGNINKMYLTKEGFDVNSGELRSSDVIEFDEVTVSSASKMLRMENGQDGITFSPYAVGTTEEFTARDLKDAQHYGSGCSKVMVCSKQGTARLIVVLPE